MEWAFEVDFVGNSIKTKKKESMIESTVEK